MEQITVLIHGTFANPQYDPKFAESGKEPGDEWWKITEGDTTAHATTADQLDAAIRSLSPAGEGTVWRPNENDGAMSYRDLAEWTGLNKHSKRTDAAKNLSTQLGALADGRGCTQERPLQVNFVAHSHGGNVVLESFKNLPMNVKPRRVNLLGTPLVWRYPDPRFVYLVFLADEELDFGVAESLK